MRMGHLMALVGSVCVTLAVALFTWQSFLLAEVNVVGLGVWPAGGVVGLHALVIVGLSVWALREQRRATGIARATMFAATSMLGWLMFAYVARHDAAVLMDHETVTMGAGYTLSLVGALACGLGPLVVFASRPRVFTNHRYLRVAVLWGESVVREQLVAPGDNVTLGDRPTDTLPVPDGYGDGHPPVLTLLTARDNGWDLMPVDGASGFAKVDGVHTTLPPSGRPLELGPTSWGSVELGELRYFFQHADPPARRPAAASSSRVDETLAAAFGISTFAQVAFVAAAILLWEERPQREVQHGQLRQPLIEASFMHVEIPADDEEELLELDPDELREFDDGAHNETVEPDADEVDVVDVVAPNKGPHQTTPSPSTEHDDSSSPGDPGKAPGETGLAKILAEASKGDNLAAVSHVLSTAGKDFDSRFAAAVSGAGSELAMGAGGQGMAFVGDGSGGGREGAGKLISQGGINTGVRDGTGRRAARAGLKRKKKRKVKNILQKGPNVRGFCNSTKVRSVVKRRAGRIRACYEQRLQARSELGGSLTTRWTIGLDGKVRGATAVKDTVKDKAMTQCVLRQVRRMRFPEPKGGVCVIQWPFVFRSE